MGAELPEGGEEIGGHPSDGKVVVAHVGNRVRTASHAVGANVDEDRRDPGRGDEFQRARIVQKSDDGAVDFVPRQRGVDVVGRLGERQVPGPAVRQEPRDTQEFVASRRAVELQRDDDVRFAGSSHAGKYSILLRFQGMECFQSDFIRAGKMTSFLAVAWNGLLQSAPCHLSGETDRR